MARTDVMAKLLNSDGSLHRERVGSREMAALIAADRVTVSRHKNGVTLRLKVLARESDSDASTCMPTLAEMRAYAEAKQHKPESELVEKIEGCRALFVCRVMDLRSHEAGTFA